MFPKPNKYKAKRTKNQYGEFPSIGEAECYAMFMIRLKAGDISKIDRYPTVLLSRAKISYKPDWYYENSQTQAYVDFKGIATERFNLIKKLWKYYGPAPLEIWKGKPAKLAEVIIPDYNR